MSTTSITPTRSGLTRSSRPDVATPACVLKLAAQGSLGLARSLGRLGVPVYGIHAGGGSPVPRSRFVRRVLPVDIDTEDPGDATERILRFGEEIGGRPLLFATDDQGALFIEDNAAVLRERFLFPEQPPGLAHELYSKKEMFFLCERLAIPTPETRFPQSRADVERFADEGGAFPVVVKPIDRWKNRGDMAIARTRDELLAAYDRLEGPGEPNMMLQDYIPGGPESVWMFNGYFDRESRCLVAFTGRKLRQYPAYTGMTSLGVCIRNEEVERLTFDLMERTGYRGVVDIGWRYDERDGTYKLLDVNPRLGNTFRLFVSRDGLDVARAQYLDLTGQAVPQVTFPHGRKWLVENFDVGASLAYLRDGALTPRSWAGQFRGVRETAWWASDDPVPFALMCGAGARTALRKAIGWRP